MTRNDYSIYTRPWCDLCKFFFDDGDHVVIVNPSASISCELRYYFSGLEAIDDDDEEQGYFPSLMDTPPGPQAYCCHCDCAKTLEPAKLLSALKKVSYDYVPPLTYFERRNHWLHRKMASDLCCHWKRLPPELSSSTVQYCLPQLASAYALSTTRFHAEKEMTLRLYDDIWVQFVTYEGAIYIAALTNTRPLDEDCASLSVRLLRPEGSVKSIHIALDHLGIRSIILATDTEKPNIIEHRGLWWTSILIQAQNEIICHSDGMKLRRLTHPAIDLTPWDRYWVAPQPYQNHLQLHTLIPNTLSLTRMNFFECNQRYIKGYSACWSSRLITIHTHRKGEEDLSFYRDWSMRRPDAVWLYMPIDETEAIEEFWKRPDNLGITILVIKTSGGRIWEIGPRPKTNREPNWCLLNRSRDQQCIFINQSWSGITSLGFQRSSLPGPVSLPTVVPKSAYPPTRLAEEFFYSSAPLANVSSIQICRRGAADIIGLLLSYQDGHHRSLGQVRFDWICQILDTRSAQGIAYRLAPDKRKVMDLIVGDEASGLEPEWTFISWAGNLAWWFSGIGCRLCHED